MQIKTEDLLMEIETIIADFFVCNLKREKSNEIIINFVNNQKFKLSLTQE
jgi:hypothetical protein